MIITITGLPGSGKTTVVKILSEILGLPWYSVGDLRGKMAEERGITIDELNAIGEQEAFTDKDVDDYQKTLGNSLSSFIIDGRLSWYFIPSSFKIFLDVNDDVGATRIFDAIQKGERKDETSCQTMEDTKKMIRLRIESDDRRYQKYYGVHFLDRSNYDLLIDTSSLTPEEVAQKILKTLKEQGIQE